MNCLNHLAIDESETSSAAVHSLDSFELAVPDLQEAAQFYSAFGLQVAPEGERLALYAPGHSHRWASLIPGPQKRLRGLAFAAFSKDFSALRSRVLAAGLPCQALTEERFETKDADGLSITVRAAGRYVADAKLPFSVTSSPAGIAGAPARAAARASPPRRLSHVAIFTGDVNRSIEFYCGILGLRVADRCGDLLAFLHGRYGSDHHLVALAHAAGPGLHHCSWDMESLDAIELSAMRMANLGYTAGWGLGRHVLGSNYFHYIKDPWGSYAEYTADLDYIPSGASWGGLDHPPEDAMYLWGPPPPADFIVNREVAVTASSRSTAGGRPAAPQFQSATTANTT